MSFRPMMVKNLCLQVAFLRSGAEAFVRFLIVETR